MVDWLVPIRSAGAVWEKPALDTVVDAAHSSVTGTSIFSRR
ncbi:hypothetical protein [Bradyrhizobium sp. BR 10261]|nr:hypothetical protein [Bradyrhizobium sp. BR 10261]